MLMQEKAALETKCWPKNQPLKLHQLASAGGFFLWLELQ